MQGLWHAVFGGFSDLGLFGWFLSGDGGTPSYGNKPTNSFRSLCPLGPAMTMDLNALCFLLLALSILSPGGFCPSGSQRARCALQDEYSGPPSWEAFQLHKQIKEPGKSFQGVLKRWCGMVDLHGISQPWHYWHLNHIILCLVLCRMFSSFCSLYSLCGSEQFPSCDNQKCFKPFPMYPGG